MKRNHFKERCEVRMTALGMVQKDLAELVGKPVPRLVEALRGDTTNAASALRVKMDLALTRLIDDKRTWMTDDFLTLVGDDLPPEELPEGTVSMILPEDLLYVVTVDGVPVGEWNPVSHKYCRFGGERHDV